MIGLALYARSILPLMFIGLPNLYGAWLMPIYGYTQHAGLAENVLDHRLNCRTVYMNPVNRYLYWNMNYHVEHHMFPLVPYHALPRLHELVKDDMPRLTAAAGGLARIVPAVLRQAKDPGLLREAAACRRQRRGDAIPAPSSPDPAPTPKAGSRSAPRADLGRDDVMRFDHGRGPMPSTATRTGTLFATDGMCTHGNTHLADGLVKGGMIECPKHNGRFNLADGSPARAPVCRGPMHLSR